MRQSAGISLRELARRTGWVEDKDVESAPGHINPGRLSVIERGVEPTEDEAAMLKRLLGGILIG